MFCVGFNAAVRSYDIYFRLCITCKHVKWCSSLSSVVSFRIDERIKRKMEELRHINWSEVVRRAIMEVIEREERD